MMICTTFDLLGVGQYLTYDTGGFSTVALMLTPATVCTLDERCFRASTLHIGEIEGMLLL